MSLSMVKILISTFSQISSVACFLFSLSSSNNFLSSTKWPASIFFFICFTVFLFSLFLLVFGVSYSVYLTWPLASLSSYSPFLLVIGVSYSVSQFFFSPFLLIFRVSYSVSQFSFPPFLLVFGVSYSVFLA